MRPLWHYCLYKRDTRELASPSDLYVKKTIKKEASANQEVSYYQTPDLSAP